MAVCRRPPYGLSALNVSRRGDFRARMVAAGLARAVADHVPDGDDFGKLDCLDAIELHLLRPAAAELQRAYEKAREPGA